MGKKYNSGKFKKSKIPTNHYAIGSIIMMVLSIGAYFLSGAIDREYVLSSAENMSRLVMVAAIASISALTAAVAIFKVPRWWKLVFVIFLLISVAEALICLGVASLIGAL